MHTELGIAHMDIKLENILVGNEFQLKICDFGFVEDILKPVFAGKGTDGYKAPEIYNQMSCGY
jgi:serine/threonine protein kinase